jgi:amino acid transporter
MPQLVRVYITSVVVGLALAVAFTAALIALDVARLGHLVLNTQGGWLAAGLLVIFNGIVFAGVQFGIRVMALAEPRKPPRGGIGAGLVPVPVPVPVTQERRR